MPSQTLESKYKYNILHVIGILLFIRTVQATIVYFTPFQFDTSSSILIDRYTNDISKTRYNYHVTQILDKLFSWDSVYFLKLSIEAVTFEHEWVFAPLWWRLMNWIINLPLANKYISGGVCIYDILLFFITFNNILLVSTTKIMYGISIEVCRYNEKMIPKNFNVSKFAYICSLLLLIQPAGIFLSVSYSETITQFLCFSALYAYLVARSKILIKNYVLYFVSGLLFTIAFGMRSNSLLYGLLYVYDLLTASNLGDGILILITGFQLFLALVYSTYAAYYTYCPERGEWCNSYTKSLVSYAQSHYWNNGFLKYFTLGNIPLFIIALPQFIIICKSLIQFKNWSGIRSLWIVSAVYTFVQFTFMHVQIINRVSSFIPLHIWYVSYLLCLNDDNIWGILIVRWWVVWVLTQTSLFAAFLPPA